MPPLWLALGTRLHRRTEADGKAILHERRGVEFHTRYVDVRAHCSGTATFFTCARNRIRTRLLLEVDQWNLDASTWTSKRAIGMAMCKHRPNRVVCTLAFRVKECSCLSCVHPARTSPLYSAVVHALSSSFVASTVLLSLSTSSASVHPSLTRRRSTFGRFT